MLSDLVTTEFRRRKIGTEFPLSLDTLEASRRRQGYGKTDYAFLPAAEIQRDMAARGEALLTLGVRAQGRYPVKDAHLWGINMMNYLQAPALFSLLKLAGVPERREGRGSESPVILLGGHIWPNPLPLAHFYDGIVLGDGEQVLVQIADLVADCPGDRGETLGEFARSLGHRVVSYLSCVVRAELGLGFHKRGEFVSEPNTWQLEWAQHCRVREECSREQPEAEERQRIRAALEELGLTWASRSASSPI